MEFTVIDTENSIHEKGSPFHHANICCVIGVDSEVFDIEHSKSPYRGAIQSVLERISKAEVIGGFNLKYEYHWLRKYGISLANSRLWDAQVFYYIYHAQRVAFPKLETVLVEYGIGNKFIDIETEYWNKGISTEDIPYEIVAERVRTDCELTRKLIEVQVQQFEEMSPEFKRLFWLEMEDLHCLADMEWNGSLFDRDRAKQLEQEDQARLVEIDESICKLFPDIPLNLNSTVHRSAILYGGTIEWTEKEQIGVYKSGQRRGEPRYKNVPRSVLLPRLVNPPERTDLKVPAGAEPRWSTDEATLRTIGKDKAVRSIVDGLLARSELEKLIGTYYKGLQEQCDLMGWDDNIIHGQFNQCVAVTGRLSSSKPNLQNQPEASKALFITRF